MGFEDVAEHGQSLFRLHHGGLFSGHLALALDHVAAFAASYVDQVGLLQLFDEIGKRAGAIGALVEGGVELEHGGFEQAELGPHFAALEDLQGALDQRHGESKLDGWRTAVPTALLLRRTLLLRLAGRRIHGTRGMFGRFHQQRFIADELVAVLLQDGGGERAAAEYEDPLRR